MQSPETPNPLHKNAVSHCKQLRVQAAIRSITSTWLGFWNMPLDSAMGDFKLIATAGCTPAYLREPTEYILRAIEQGDLVIIQSFLEENPSYTLEDCKELLRYILVNFDEVDAEAKKQLGTITYEEVMAIMNPQGDNPA